VPVADAASDCKQPVTVTLSLLLFGAACSRLGLGLGLVLGGA
jgi:hypothetical protein